jgi:DivIVA domain-containing protein
VITGIEFSVVLRGYDRVEVDALIARAGEAIQSGDTALRAAVRDELLTAALNVRMRGYDRSQVDGVRRRYAEQLEQSHDA